MQEHAITIGAAIAAIGAAYALLRKMRADVRKEFQESREQSRAAVTQANGTPLAIIEASPQPSWAKGIDGRMRLINFAYEQAFNIRREDYIGRLDVEVWDRATALAFSRHDDAVLHERRMIEFVESIPIDRSRPDGPRKRLLVQKFPIWNSGMTEVIAIGGCCWDADRIDVLIRRAEAAELVTGTHEGKAKAAGAIPDSRYEQAANNPRR